MATTKPAKTTKATSTKKAGPKFAMVLKALSDAASAQKTLDAQVKQVTTTLAAAGIGSDIGTVAFAGRSSTGGWCRSISAGGFSSQWPEWLWRRRGGAALQQEGVGHLQQPAIRKQPDPSALHVPPRLIGSASRLQRVRRCRAQHEVHEDTRQLLRPHISLDTPWYVM